MNDLIDVPDGKGGQIYFPDMGVYDRGLERVVSRVLGNPAQQMVQERVGKDRSSCRIP